MLTEMTLNLVFCKMVCSYGRKTPKQGEKDIKNVITAVRADARVRSAVLSRFHNFSFSLTFSYIMGVNGNRLLLVLLYFITSAVIIDTLQIKAVELFFFACISGPEICKMTKKMYRCLIGFKHILISNFRNRPKTPSQELSRKKLPIWPHSSLGTVK